MLWLKAFHIIGVVAWFAGLFYLPRLYLYHADTQDSISKERFVIMERRLFVIMTIGASVAVFFGAMMLIESPAYLRMGWLRVKLLLVLLLIAYHVYCYAFLKDFAAQRNKRSANWYRAFNEVPSLFLIAIVVLAVVKPF
jgi:protoporphyrinogen IX oxidase